MRKDLNTILVAYAEDHTLLRQAIVENMDNSGEVKIIIQAANGIELIEKISISDRLPAIVLMDIDMPEMDGFETTLLIKEKWDSIKVIALTSYEEDSFLFRMIKCGASAYLPKRASPKELIKAIHAVVNDEVYNTELFTNSIGQIRQKLDKQISFCAIEEMLLKNSKEEKTIDELAKQLGLKYKTLESRLYKLYEKIGVKSKIGLLLFAIRNGYVKP